MASPLLNLQPLPGSRRYVVIGEWRCRGYTVPNGFTTDGASIPRPFWFIIGSPFAPETIQAATLHDYLYRKGLVTQEQADREFLAQMLDDYVPRWRATTMYVAVRRFGGMFHKS